MRPLCSFILIGATALASGAAADVLVTTDGSVVETQGPWEQRGKMVVFRLDSGQLSSLRAEDVDFEATRRWREALAEETQPATPATPRPKARLVLTDADVARAPATPEPAAASEGVAEEPTADAPGQSPVRVIAWDEEEPEDGEGRRIFGTLRNDGNTFATGVRIEVTVYDDSGAIAGTATAAPVRDSLRPGESTTFSVQFPEVYVVGATRMRVASVDLDLGEADAEGVEELPEADS